MAHFWLLDRIEMEAILCGQLYRVCGAIRCTYEYDLLRPVLNRTLILFWSILRIEDRENPETAYVTSSYKSGNNKHNNQYKRKSPDEDGESEGNFP